jgi:thiol-disulfide isomerase/thioredoxin
LTTKLPLQARRVTLQTSASSACARLVIFALFAGGCGFTSAAWAAEGTVAKGIAEAPGFQFKPWPRGKAVPDFSGVDLQGTPWNLQALRGQPVLINFWASWCEPCRAEMPSLQALTETREGESREGPPRANLTPKVFAVNFKESTTAAQRFVQQTQLHLPVLRDADGTVAKRWGVSIFPSTVLVGADGKVRGTVVGELDWTSPAAQPVLRRLNRE